MDRRLLAIGAIATALFAAAVGLAFVGTSDSGKESNTSESTPAGEARTVSEEELRSFGRTQTLPIYWAGPRPDTSYELTRTADGRVFIRYLPEGADAGDPRPRFLTVASYAQPNAYAFLRAQSRRDGWTGQRTESGALVASTESRPTSVYFAFEDADLQVEVFDPDLNEARDLVLEGEIQRLQ